MAAPTAVTIANTLRVKRCGRAVFVISVRSPLQGRVRHHADAVACLRDAVGGCHPLHGQATRIGRLADNDIVIDDGTVSRYHAVIVDTGNSFVVTDLQSANGVEVRAAGSTAAPRWPTATALVSATTSSPSKFLEVDGAKHGGGSICAGGAGGNGKARAMTTSSAERYLSAALLNKGPRERLCDVDAMLNAITDHAVIQLDVLGNIVRWCPGAEALLGYSAAEALDRPMSMFHLEEHRAGGLAERELAAARESGRHEFEGWRLRKSGQMFWARVVLSTIRDEAGTVTGFAKVIRDVTAEHRRTETMFHDLLEAAPDAMIIAAADGRIVLANAQTDEMFGYRREDLIGMEVKMLIPPRLRETHERHRARFFASPKVRRMGAGLELRGLRRDGTEFPIEVSLSPLRTDRGVLVSAAMRDITERMATQSDLADAYAEAEVFAERDRIGSELQDHAIQRVFAVGLALQATIPRVRSTEVQQRLMTAVDDLHGVVQDFRTAIFGLRTRSADVTRVRRRLDELIGELSGGLATTVQYKGPLSALGVELAEHAEAVVAEAISNAVRHAGATKLTVVVDVADLLCIEVADDGKGMRGNVTGTGLADLRRRAEAIGGTLNVDDGPRGGTRLRWAAPLP